MFVYVFEFVKVRAVVFLFLPFVGSGLQAHTPATLTRRTVPFSFLWRFCYIFIYAWVQVCMLPWDTCVAIRDSWQLLGWFFFYPIKTSLIVSMDGLSELQTSDDTSRHQPSQSRCDGVSEGSPGSTSASVTCWARWLASFCLPFWMKVAHHRK